MLLIIHVFSLDMDLGMLKKLALQLNALDLLCDSAIQLICKCIFLLNEEEVNFLSELKKPELTSK